MTHLLYGEHDQLVALVEGNYFRVWDTLRRQPVVNRSLDTITAGHHETLA